MKKAERKELSLKSLFLDKKNPRLVITIRKNNESLEEQFLRSIQPRQIVNLMKSLLEEMTFNLSDIFCVIKKNEKYLVLDGNRRLLAYMLLSKATKVQNKKINEFLDMNFEKIKLFLRENKSVLCVIYPNRESAMKFIDMNHLFSHDGISTLEWIPFARKIAKKDLFALAFKDILDEKGIQIVSLKTKITIFERIFQDKDIKDKFKVSIKSSKNEKFLEILEKEMFFKFFNFIESKKINFNDVYAKADKIRVYNEFLDSIKESKDIDIKNVKNFDSISLSNVPSIKTKKTIHKKSFSNFSNLEALKDVIGTKNAKIYNVISQINSLNIQKYKELISFSIRPLIEISTNKFLLNVLKKSKTWMKNNNKDLKVRVKESISEIRKKGKIKAEHSTTMKNIEKIINLDNFLGFSNGDLHDINFSSSVKELRDNIKRIEIYLEEIWRSIN